MLLILLGEFLRSVISYLNYIVVQSFILLGIQEMSTDYYNNSKYYCIEYLIPMSDVIFDMAYPPETVEEKTAEFLQQAILRLYDEWKRSSFVCDDNLILRLSDDACIKPEWFVEAEEL